MTIDTENAHYLMIAEITIEVGPNTAWPPKLSQTFLFFMIFQNLSESLFQIKIESHFDKLMSTVPLYIALIVPFFDYYRGTLSWYCSDFEIFCQLKIWSCPNSIHDIPIQWYLKTITFGILGSIERVNVDKSANAMCG